MLRSTDLLQEPAVRASYIESADAHHPGSPRPPSPSRRRFIHHRADPIQAHGHTTRSVPPTCPFSGSRGVNSGHSCHFSAYTCRSALVQVRPLIAARPSKLAMRVELRASQPHVSAEYPRVPKSAITGGRPRLIVDNCGLAHRRSTRLTGAVAAAFPNSPYGFDFFLLFIYAVSPYVYAPASQPALGGYGHTRWPPRRCGRTRGGSLWQWLGTRHSSILEK